MMDNSPLDMGTVLLADSFNSNAVKHREDHLAAIGSNGHFLTFVALTDSDGGGAHLLTAPLSAWTKAAPGLAERTSCWTCCTRGRFCSVVGPLHTTVLTTPDTQARTHTRGGENQEKTSSLGEKHQVCVRVCVCMCACVCVNPLQ